MILIGFYGGFIHAGIGFLIMAILYRTLNLNFNEVNMHKVFIVGSYTLIAAIIFALEKKICWSYGITLAIGNSVGGWFGVRFSITKGKNIIKNIINLTLLFMAIKLLFYN